jgi:hypothetical protein
MDRMGSAPKVPKPAYVPSPMQPSPAAKLAGTEAANPLLPQRNAGTILTSPMGVMGQTTTGGKALTGA